MDQDAQDRDAQALPPSPKVQAEQLDKLMSRNHALAQALNRAGEELSKAKAQLAQLAQPPLTLATMLRVDKVRHDEHGIQQASAEVLAGARRMIVPVAANLNAARLVCGRSVLLNADMVLVEQRETDTVGQLRQVKQVLEDGRIIATDASGNPAVVRVAGALATTSLNPGDRVSVEPSGRVALELIGAEDDADLVLEETPDVSFEDIGGLDAQIERIRDAVQLPFNHRDLFARFDLQPPKGVLLYGPPGNGKTLIAKAIAHALASPSHGGAGVFLSVKGPELLNKFVGESERLIRLIFRKARERAASGRPVIVFIDEMDSLLRTRGSGVSSDVETTIVPQFLTELDGVERLDNVMVIGASNRVDMIDPAVLRPGRLDVKIRVDRPQKEQALSIIRHYLTDDLPIEAGSDAQGLSRIMAEDIYAHGSNRKVAEACDERGVWNPLYLDNVVSGAMLKNIVDRAKTKAVKASILNGSDVALDTALIAQAVEEEYVETKAAMLDVDPAQWARINGLELEGIVRIRPAGRERA